MLKIAEYYQNGSHFGFFGAQLEFIDSRNMGKII
jgi:hypothetical protein